MTTPPTKKKDDNNDEKPDQSLPGGRRPHADHDLPDEGKPPSRLKPAPLPTDEVEIVLGDLVITATVAERGFQITHEGKTYLHKGEDAEGRWVYQPA